MVQARSNAEPRIKTTVVGSYPFPDWLAALPSEQALLDATRVVIHTQEQAGIDVVCDGELSRFDVNHPETNGMIEYFVRPMAGIRPCASRSLRPTGRNAGWAFGRGHRRSSMAQSAPARSTCHRPARAPSGLPAGHSSSP
jgi:methionine synthase II (cobalamin-independent)